MLDPSKAPRKPPGAILATLAGNQVEDSGRLLDSVEVSLFCILGLGVYVPYSNDLVHGFDAVPGDQDVRRTFIGIVIFLYRNGPLDYYPFWPYVYQPVQMVACFVIESVAREIDLYFLTDPCSRRSF